jgi:hypothetical protein
MKAEQCTGTYPSLSRYQESDTTLCKPLSIIQVVICQTCGSGGVSPTRQHHQRVASASVLETNNCTDTTDANGPAETNTTAVNYSCTRSLLPAHTIYS